MRVRLGALLVLLASPVVGSPVAAATADCVALVGAVERLTGLTISAPPAGPEGGTCVLDGARLTGEGAPRITLQTLRIGGTVSEGRVQSLDIDGAGLRVAPALIDRDMAGWLRDLLRLQTAEVRLSLRRDDARDLLLLDNGALVLSGGGELRLSGELAGADLSSSSLVAGRVTKLYLEWKNEGRSLRPIMEAAGGALAEGATGSDAVEAARAALLDIAEALPPGSFSGGSLDEVKQLFRDLPLGRGRLVVRMASPDGIGAVQLAFLALADDPSGPKALGQFLAGTSLSVDWQPGLQP